LQLAIRPNVHYGLGTIVHEVQSPSVFVSWAHGDPDWSQERARAWELEVSSFVTVLRSLGVDVDIDLYHLHDRTVDWTRWGPVKVQTSDIVLGIVSPAWRARLEGHNAPTEGAGAVAEADVLLGTFGRDQDELRAKLVLVVLPSMRGADAIPDRFHGIARVTLDDLSPSSVTSLLHLLLGVPVHGVPPLGQLPDLVPLTGPMPRPADETRLSQATEMSTDARLRLLDERIGVLRETLSRMARPHDDEGPNARSWGELRRQLDVLERQRDHVVDALATVSQRSAQGLTPALDLVWDPHSGVDFPSVDEGEYRISIGLYASNARSSAMAEGVEARLLRSYPPAMVRDESRRHDRPLLWLGSDPPLPATLDIPPRAKRRFHLLTLVGPSASTLHNSPQEDICAVYGYREPTSRDASRFGTLLRDRPHVPYRFDRLEGVVRNHWVLDLELTSRNHPAKHYDVHVLHDGYWPMAPHTDRAEPNFRYHLRLEIKAVSPQMQQ
jgi:hypothetical protein